MRSLNADGQARLISWRHVREYAVPASMIETATARRHAGDWAGACTAAQFDVDLDLRTIASLRGREFAALVRADLRRLAPDLLRWNLPRTVSDGLLRPGLTISLARYTSADHYAHLVVRTAPSWADSGQRISLALWDPAADDTGPHPRPRPDRRFRLDLHPHLWAADRAHELGERCGADELTGPPRPGSPADTPDGVPVGRGYAAHRWAAEATILRNADGWSGPVVVRLGNGRRVLLPDDTVPDAPTAAERPPVRRGGQPVLPYAATWLPPDLELLRAGMITADLLHPLVAEGLAPGRHRTTFGTAASGPRTASSIPTVAGTGLTTAAPGPSSPGIGSATARIRPTTAGAGHSVAGTRPTNAGNGQAGHGPAGNAQPGYAQPGNGQAGNGQAAAGDDGVRLVECCGTVHRVALVDGRLMPLDHDAEELGREELLAVLGGPPLPCLRAIRTVTRNPESLDEIRTRLVHGDQAGAEALVSALLGPGARLEGALGEAFAAAAEGRIEHGLYRAGLAARVPAGVTVPFGSRKERHGRRGRPHRLPKRTARLH
ncbi:hypothetical protein AB0G04_05395 [Actinoplanes sp. NPDC023801]|uniref:hypothetical protein n=1 Tax=Actinoplanes sp. NPDC023801 TaxID=3154595 RepID=UPI0033EBD60B